MTVKKNNGQKHHSKPITTIIFDFGNVLVVDTEKAFEEMLDIQRLPQVRRVRYEMATHSTERGEQSTKYLLQVMKEEFGLPLSIEQIHEMMVSTELIQPVWDLMQQLRGHYKIAILSNNQKTWPKEMAKRLGLSFAGIKFFNSAVIGSRKPEKEPYEYALKHLKSRPEQTVFIDDKKTNVDTAKDLDMHGIHFTGNMENLLRRLKECGVTVTMSKLKK